MRDRMERLVVLPFSIGCVSQSSVSVVEAQPKGIQQESNPSSTSGDECTTQAPKTKTSIGLLPMERLQRLIKSFKSLSHLFYNDDNDEDNDNEMEIGLPTDVLHVAHIGCDTPNALPSMINGWDFPITAPPPPPPPTDLPFLSLGQFELAMARQATVSSPAQRST